jgi:hypothetical protein
MKWKAALALSLSLVASWVWPGPGSSGPDEETPDSLRYTFYDSLYAHELPTDTFTNLLPGFVGFGEGEKLVFSVQYSLVKAGEATLEIRNIADIGGRPCYRVISDARTNKFFSAFFKVRDRFESYVDTTELYSLRYEKHVREGRFKRDESVVFNQTEHTATYDDKVVPIAPRTQDVLSALYYMRTLPLEVGQAITLANHTDGKNYPLVVKVHRRETVTVDAGTFDCLVVEPILRGPAIFSQKGRLTVWITDDRYRMPVLMKSKVIIGHVSAVLTEYTRARKAQ